MTIFTLASVMNYNKSHHSGHCQIPTKGDGCSLSGLVGILVMEIWKDIPGYENLYRVSTFGNVKSYKKIGWMNRNNCTRIFKPKDLNPSHSHGYLNVRLTKNKKSKLLFVHRLVLLAFIPNPENKPQVNHKNGIKTDNRIDNLEWVTAVENIAHSLKTGLAIRKSGEDHHYAKLSNNQVKEIRSLKDNVKFLANKYDVSIQTIYNILKFKTFKNQTK